MKKMTTWLAIGTFLLGGILGLGLLTRGPAALAAGATTTAPAIAEKVSAGGTVEANSPSYTATIRVANAQDQKEKSSASGEASEAAQLASQAKITAEQAKAAALKAVPGQVAKVELDNENGNLVYSVEVKDTQGKSIDVKVDAGNGQVLTMELGKDQEGPEGTEVNGVEKETKAAPHADSDNDTTEVQEEGGH